MSVFRTGRSPGRRRRSALAGLASAAVLGASALLAVLAPSGTAAPGTAAATASDPLLGVNMSFFDGADHLATDSATQTLFRGWGTPMVRVPLRSAFDDGTAVTDAQLLTALRGVQAVGAAPVLILHGPGGGRTDADITTSDSHLLDLVHQVFGNSTAYLEFGNEPDLGSATAEAYAASWSAVIPTLKSLYPSADYQFVGPDTSRVDGTYADYIGTFLANASPAPDLLSWHEYVCDTTASGWQSTCTSHLANWQTHVTNVENIVSATIGRTLDYLISEWNIDADSAGQAYTSANTAYLSTWTTQAIATLRALSPAPAGAMIYTATDHGDFALVKGSTTLTTQGTAFQAAIGTGGGGTTPPPSSGVTVGFEDGTTQNWSGYYGNANPAVTTDLAYEGTHALRFTLNSGGHTAVGTGTNLSAVQPGSTITYHVYAAQSGTTVTPFVRDKNYSPTSVGPVALPAGRWTTVTWTVPSVASIGAIGLDASPGTGTVTLDALTWPTP
ncbi:hypothetical protein [Streptomyces sp. NPDC047000]|uniref:hypothetical protein n=1 Tax=Streptomyces sp. NPDC047000 TaxID=3155474 RepID=UPI00340ACDBA